MALFAREIVTLSLEDQSLRALTVRDGKVARWGELPLSPGLVKEGLIQNPGQVGGLVKSFLAGLKAPAKKAVVGISGVRSVTRYIDLPRMSPSLLEEAVVREAKREMPVPLEELYLSWQVVEGIADRQTVFLLGVPREVLDALALAMQAAGIRPYLVDLKPLALVRAARESVAVIADLELASLSVIIVTGGLPALIRSISLNRAETEDKVYSLIQEVERTAKFYNDSHKDAPLPEATPVVLTGDLAGLPTLAAGLAERLHNPARLSGSPLPCPDEFPAYKYLANLGLALKKGA
ncbi:MAG: pilus assembly protein PilM [Chloroflexota bacterium]